MVLSPNHPQLAQVQDYLKQTGLDLHDIINAPKLSALRTLLFECGIGEEDIDKKQAKIRIFLFKMSYHNTEP